MSAGDDGDYGEELLGGVLENVTAGTGATRLADVFVELERRQDEGS